MLFGFPKGTPFGRLPKGTPFDLQKAKQLFPSLRYWISQSLPKGIPLDRPKGDVAISLKKKETYDNGIEGYSLRLLQRVD